MDLPYVIKVINCDDPGKKTNRLVSVMVFLFTKISMVKSGGMVRLKTEFVFGVCQDSL